MNSAPSTTIPKTIHESWYPLVSDLFEAPFMIRLRSFLVREKQAGKTVYPSAGRVFRAFEVPIEQTKVVIVGQDPYHTKGTATGLAFASGRPKYMPPSLENIFVEIEREFGKRPEKKDLLGWAKQGVLLLNTKLTVEAGKAGSHSKKGWETFTFKVLERLSTRLPVPLVYMFWGKHAQQLEPLINNYTWEGDEKVHRLKLTSAHPSPFSASKGFFGNKHFIRANEFLMEHGLEPIDWTL